MICAYGRLGTMFGADKFGYQPDIITTAKGLTSGYAALGAAIISEKIFEPFSTGTVSFPHGYTFGGHPVACAAALANLDLFESEDLLGNVLRNEGAFEATLRQAAGPADRRRRPRQRLLLVGRAGSGPGHQGAVHPG